MNHEDRGKQSNKVGHLCETKASIFLRLKGYKIVAKNFKPKSKTGAGEIDLIGTKGNVIVFFEVKYRSTDVAYSITPQIQQRRIKGAEYFLLLHPQFANFDIRFDVILFSPLSILPQHIENAFQLDG